MTETISNTISTTQLARNLSAAIDRVRIERRPLVIKKGKSAVAELNPTARSGYPITDLAALLASLPKQGEDAARTADDLARIRRNAALPVNPWAS